MSATSVTDICNNALLLLGVNPATNIATDGTVAANVCNQMYEPTRDALLRRHFWNFATQRISLAASSTAPAFGYAHAYPLPADFIRVRSIDQQVYTYKIEAGQLLTDANAPLKLVYISRITDVTKYDPLFIEALVWALVIKVGQRILGDGFDPNKLQYTQQFQQALFAAQTADSQDASPDNLQMTTFIDGRFGFSTDVWTSMGDG